MKFKLFVVSFLTILVCSCSSKTSKYLTDLDNCISKTQSIQTGINNQLESDEFENLLLESEVRWNQLKLHFENSLDTLSKEQLLVLDDFKVAFKNARALKKESLRCLLATSKLQLRLNQLKQDIELGSGNRSDYCANIQHEKEELTIIESHAKDIHRRFEELKRSKAQFDQQFALN